MQIEVTPGEVTIAAITGSIDSLTAEQLLEVLGRTVRERQVRVVADFSRVATRAVQVYGRCSRR